MSFGDSSTLGLRITWTDDPRARTAAEHTQGELCVELDGHLVWGECVSGIQRGVSWTWIELLERLATSWKYLKWEDFGPFGMTEHPRDLRQAAGFRWQKVSEAQREAEEWELYRYEERHDLAQALGGLHLPSLWLVRRGNQMLVSCRRIDAMLPVDQALQTLAGLGDAISDRLLNCGDERATIARRTWTERAKSDPEKFTEIVSGRDRDYLRLVRGGRTSEEVFGIGSSLVPNELLAAARMTPRELPTEDMAKILDQICSLSRVAVTRLDEWSQELLPLVGARQRPHEQGYAAANWLRGQCELPGGSAVDLETLYRSLGIRVLDVSLKSEVLEAVAVWGPAHGPGVLINISRTRSSTKPGRRFSMAHELCHLLLDRSSARPLVDVMVGPGTRGDDEVEKRANAFAAEFLLPRSQLPELFTTTENLTETAEGIVNRFQIGRELLYRQVQNARAHFGKPQVDEATLENWARASSPGRP